MLRANNNYAFAESYRDPRAALDTSRSGAVLARRLGAREWVAGFVGNIGEFALRTGDWSAALTEIAAALAEGYEAEDEAGLRIVEAAIRACRGESVDRILSDIDGLISSSGDARSLSGRAVAAGFAAFAAGELDEARSAWLDAGRLMTHEQYVSVPRVARAALWANDARAAQGDLDRLDASGFHGSAIEADRRTIRAGIAALEGRPADALSLYGEAVRAWRLLGLVWDEALCGIDMATLLDPADPEVRAAAESAREILVRLDAKPFIARLDAAMARSVSDPGLPSPSTASPLETAPSAT